MSIYMWKEYVVPSDALYFEANTANSTVKLTKTGSPTVVTLETSTDGVNWSTYTFGSTITLSNVGDKVYMRNKSETTTGFSTSTSNYYQFSMSGSIAAHGDINYLINKNSTNTLTSDYCYYYLFGSCASLTSSPKLSATTLSQYCYYSMFYYCTSLTMPPELPATITTNSCYNAMFYGCVAMVGIPKLPSSVLADLCYANMFRACQLLKISNTQTGEYQTPYRIPITGTSSSQGTNWNVNMLYATGGTYQSYVYPDTTYYTSNTLV